MQGVTKAGAVLRDASVTPVAQTAQTTATIGRFEQELRMSSFAATSLVVLLFAVAAAVQASPLPEASPGDEVRTVEFSGGGLVEWVTPPVGLLYELQVRAETTQYIVDAEPWQLESRFSFDAATFTGTGSGRFLNAQGTGDEIRFTFTSVGGARGLDLAYTITGGAGDFAGARGSGASLVQLYGNPIFAPSIPFGDLEGRLALTVPSPVPELPSGALLALGLAVLGTALRRGVDRDGPRRLGRR